MIEKEKTDGKNEETEAQEDGQELFDGVYEEYKETIEYWGLGYSDGGIEDGQGIWEEFSSMNELRDILDEAEESMEHHKADGSI